MAWGGSLSSYEIADFHHLVSTGDIKLETLAEIENNLTDCKKVSLVFLLYEDVNAAIERLEMLVGHREKDSRRLNLLKDWAKGGEQQYWKETLLEGLAIIKAYKEIKDLNYYPQQVKDHFSPDQLDKSIFIHPVKKALFGMREEFLIKDTKKFIRDLLDNSEIAIKNHCDYLELFLLHMMKNKIITVGTWSPLEMTRTQTQEKSNLDIIYNFLKMNKFVQLHDALNSVEDFVKNTFNSKTDASKSTISIHETSVLNEKDDISKYPIYDITSVGWFLIFNHTTFVKTNMYRLTDRSGTEKDVMELVKCWSSYGFTTVVFNDLKAENILKEIKKHADIVKESLSAFGVCILSHGNSSGVFGSDGNLISKNDIKKSLLTDNLVGKPKILIVEASRGKEEAEEYEEKTYDKYNLDGPEVIPEKADLLEFWSTVDNSPSYRHPNHGSLFIQTLCKCLTEHGNTKHLVDIFIKVTDEIGKRNIQITEYVSTLRKHLYLNPNA